MGRGNFLHTALLPNKFEKIQYVTSYENALTNMGKMLVR